MNPRIFIFWFCWIRHPHPCRGNTTFQALFSATTATWVSGPTLHLSYRAHPKFWRSEMPSPPPPPKKNGLVMPAISYIDVLWCESKPPYTNCGFFLYGYIYNLNKNIKPTTPHEIHGYIVYIYQMQWRSWKLMCIVRWDVNGASLPILGNMRAS